LFEHVQARTLLVHVNTNETRTIQPPRATFSSTIPERIRLVVYLRHSVAISLFVGRFCYETPCNQINCRNMTQFDPIYSDYNVMHR